MKAPPCFDLLWAHTKVTCFRLLQARGVRMAFPYVQQDNRAKVEGYPTQSYVLFARDRARNEAYKAAIARHVPGKTVVEVGTGPLALHALECIRQGARHVYAIEANPRSFERARRLVRAHGVENRLTVLQGYSFEVSLPERCDVLVQEIIGSVGSAEGMVRIARDARARLLKDDATWIPAAVATRLCPVSPVAYPPLNGVVSRLGGGVTTMRPRGIYRVYNFPQENFLAEPAVAEEIRFSRGVRTHTEQQHEFQVVRDGLFDGFAFFIVIELREGSLLNVLDTHTNWDTPYVRLLEKPMPVRRGDRIRARFTGDLATTRPTYELEIAVLRDTSVEHEDRFTWFGI